VNYEPLEWVAARAEGQRQAAALSGRRAALAAKAEALRSSRVFAERAAGWATPAVGDRLHSHGIAPSGAWTRCVGC